MTVNRHWLDDRVYTQVEHRSYAAVAAAISGPAGDLVEVSLVPVEQIWHRTRNPVFWRMNSAVQRT